MLREKLSFNEPGRPRIVYPASGRDLSWLAMADELLEADDIESINIVCTDQSDEERLPAKEHIERVQRYLKKYAALRGGDFELEETDELNYV